MIEVEPDNASTGSLTSANVCATCYKYDPQDNLKEVVSARIES